jgi:hypothetical protein
MDIKQVVDLLNTLNSANSSSNTEHPYVVGENYFIRTVTYHITGKLKAVFPGELVLTEAAWVADSGRFSAALKSCDFLEVEPFHRDVIVNRGAICDVTTIDRLPREVK